MLIYFNHIILIGFLFSKLETKDSLAAIFFGDFYPRCMYREDEIKYFELI